MHAYTDKIIYSCFSNAYFRTFVGSRYFMLRRYVMVRTSGADPTF